MLPPKQTPIKRSWAFASEMKWAKLQMPLPVRILYMPYYVHLSLTPFHATDLSHEQISEFRAKGVIVVEGVELTTEEVKVHLSIYIYLSLVLRIFFLSKRTI